MMAGVACVSVLENNKDMSFVFHIFTDGYSKDSQEKINELAKQWQCACILYRLNMTPFEDFHIKVARFSRITYARIYMPKVIIMPRVYSSCAFEISEKRQVNWKRVITKSIKAKFAYLPFACCI